MLILLLCLCLISYVCIYVIITVCSCCTLCLSLVNTIFESWILFTCIDYFGCFIFSLDWFLLHLVTLFLWPSIFLINFFCIYSSWFNFLLHTDLIKYSITLKIVLFKHLLTVNTQYVYKYSVFFFTQMSRLLYKYK